MNQTDDDNSETFSDEDESYKNVQNRMLYSTPEASIINESTTETNSDDETYLDDLSETRSRRESTILPVKKKSARILSSDDEEENSDLDTERTPNIRYTSPLDQQSIDEANSRENSNESAPTSQSFLKVQRKSLFIESDSEDESFKTQVPRNKSIRQSNSTTNKSAFKNRRDKSDVIVNSDSDGDSAPEPIEERSLAIDSHSDSEDSTKVLSSADIPTQKNSTKASQSSKLDEASDIFNGSAKMKPSRISQQFQYNSEGILNSTSIHSGNRNPTWRLSNNFNQLREVNEIPSDPSIEILSDRDSDIIEVSSDEYIPSPKKTPFKLPKIKNATRQQTLHSFVQKKEPSTPQPKESVVQNHPPVVKHNPLIEIQPNVQSPKVSVSHADYESQWSRVSNLEIDVVKLQNIIENINYEALPDKGQLIKERLRIAENRYRQEKDKLDKMNVSDTKNDAIPKGALANVAWEDIEAGTNAVLPKTFGKTAMSTYNAQKAVTLDRLQQLHEALQTCPKEDDHENDPKGIKVPLMPHQRRALAWVLFREKEKPSGGILADDMGLGKTLTMISLIVKSLELEKSEDSDEEKEYIGKNTKYNGGSLIVCPASLINQWSGEIDRRLKRGLVSYVLYHGPKRETRAKKLAEYDIVITTYAIINNEAERCSAAFKIKWRRVILDEAHTIRNYKAQTSVACCQLLAKSRWALTGTPMHNKELDMYSLLKFLRCSPFDDLQVWKRWVGDKSTGGLERLHTVISSLMLRRTKAELMEKGALNCMPDKKWELVKIQLDKNELEVYHKVLIFSQTLFAQFLHQRAEKNQDYIDHKFTEVSQQAPNQEYHKMRQKLLKLNKVKDVSQHEILVLLLRLRQICCHPSLITDMLDDCNNDIGEGDEECEQLNLLDQLEKLNIDDEDEFQPEGNLSSVAQGISQGDKVSLKEASRGQLRPSDPVFAKGRASSKIKALLKELQERVLSKNDKAIIVSQWSSYLKLVAMHLKDLKVDFDQLDGTVPVNKRMDMVDRLNNPRDKMRVLLLSLTAGGVGLNLVGANHLFLLDLHWNPQLENQAQDRIYRVGQTKSVFVYKFMATDTIEERIKALQDKKLAMAEGLLTGTKQATQSKLSMEDLRMIFGM